jgi:hypothetical protein
MRLPPRKGKMGRLAATNDGKCYVPDFVFQNPAGYWVSNRKGSD